MYKTEKGVFERQGFHLPYVIEGEGIPCLVIGCARYYPGMFSPSLRDHFKFIFATHRVYATPQLTEKRDYELEVLLADMAALQEHLGIEKVLVMGHSAHSYMALEYAKRYPEKVTGVVMIGISPSLNPDSQQQAEETFFAKASKERIAQYQENHKQVTDEYLATLPETQRFIKNYVRNGPKLWYDYEYDATELWDGVSVNLPMFEYVWGEQFPALDITKDLDKVSVPILLALGRHDYIVAPPESWDEVMPQFKDITVKIFEKSGHTPQYETADEFDKALINWISKINHG